MDNGVAKPCAIILKRFLKSKKVNIKKNKFWNNSKAYDTFP